ncbi:hypothetical protein WR25_08069 isoform G [Diploscapter pachys]|nr:hypothetical protein WR25_08069 isoform B [Diploscapter pachys]PAV56636.1 hypothetical protein WR25_08069 isoform C [Diploscapter pachys]PAV56637.1 hypothetical protein WR25_08069 isoform D [Diploscapter pachys]PAV56638.1 hypothetical protein WR25_08069 isoform E [Diploscapter pachys]PAV56639.1 hypothetical protein WR25_08069 isoform F [Diploscapter pachys]
MLLNTLPVELVTEILLNLPIRELIATVQVNRHLYNIAHAERGIVQRRFDYEQAFSLELVVTDSSSQKSALTCECGFPMCKTINLKIFRAENEYKAKESDDEYEAPNTDEPPGLTLKVWKACECRKTKQKMRIDAYDLLKSSTFLTTMDEYIRTGYKKVRVTHLPLEEMLQIFIPFFSELLNYYIIRKFKLDISFGLEIWQKLVPLFDKNSSVFHNPPSVRLYSIPNFNADDLFSCKLFDRGIDHVSYDFVNDVDDRDKVATYHEVLKTANKVNITGYTLGIYDEDLVTFFSKIKKLYLCGADKLTSLGIAQFVKMLYNERQAPNRRLIIDGDAASFDLKEIMSLMPNNSFEYNSDEREATMTNTFGEKFTIRHLGDAPFNQLSIIDLISAIKINRRLYNIAHAEKCLFRHRLVKQHFDLSLMAEGVKNARRNRNDDDDFEICDCQV